MTLVTHCATPPSRSGAANGQEPNKAAFSVGSRLFHLDYLRSHHAAYFSRRQLLPPGIERHQGWRGYLKLGFITLGYVQCAFLHS